MLSIVLITVSPKTSFFMLPTRLWEFLFGACAAWLQVTKSTNKSKEFASFYSIMFLGSRCFFLSASQDLNLSVFTGHPSLAALIVVLSTTAIISIGLGEMVSSKGRVSRIFIMLGDYSYSIYLVHFPIIILTNYTEFGGTRLGFNDISHLVSIVCLTMVASFFLYTYVEKLRYSRYATVTIVGLLSACIVLGAFGGSLNKSGYSQMRF